MIYSTLECLELRAKEGELGAKWEGERKKICTEETHIPKECMCTSHANLQRGPPTIELARPTPFAMRVSPLEKHTLHIFTWHLQPQTAEVSS